MDTEEFKLEDETEEADSNINENEEIKLQEEFEFNQEFTPKQSKEKKKVESVSVDLTELISQSLKAKQEEVKQLVIEEEAEEDIVHIHLMHNPTRLKVNIRSMDEKDIELLESIRPLLEGKEVYKKFSSSSSLSQVPYDPFNNKKPERCGFGRRLIRLNPEDITQVMIVNKLNLRKNGYYIEKKSKHSYVIKL